MFELFQYTACRLLPLDRCKLESARVTRLIESAARAIVPPVAVLSQLRGADHNIPAVSCVLYIKFPVHLNGRLYQGDLWTVFNSKSHRDESPLGIFFADFLYLGALQKKK